MTDLKRLERRAAWGLVAVPLIYGGVRCGMNPLWSDEFLGDVYTFSAEVTEEHKAEFRHVTHLDIPSSAKFLLYARISGFQSGSTHMKLRLTRGELRRLLRSPGLNVDSLARPMPNIDDLPGWLPGTIRKPRYASLQPVPLDDEHRMVDVLSSAAPKDLNDVYIVAGDPP